MTKKKPFLYDFKIGHNVSQFAANISWTRGVGLQMIAQYEWGFRNSLVITRALKMKGAKVGHAFLSTKNWKQLLDETHVKASVKCFRYLLLALQQSYVICRRLVR